MKVLQRKPVREEKEPQMPMWVPAWVKRGVGFTHGDESEWYIMEDDDGTKFGALRRIPKEKEGEEKKGEEGEEDGEK